VYDDDYPLVAPYKWHRATHGYAARGHALGLLAFVWFMVLAHLVDGGYGDGRCPGVLEWVVLLVSGMVLVGGLHCCCPMLMADYVDTARC
jgi:hypothetical protein